MANPYLVATRVAPFLPINLIRAIVGLGAWAAWAKKGKATGRFEGNLHRVTGLEGRALRRLSRRGMSSYARYWAEVFELGRMTHSTIDARIRTTGADAHALEQIRAHECISVVLSHSGNWDIVGAWTSRNYGPVSTVAEILEPREVFDEFVAFRKKLGMTVLGHEGGATFRQMIRLGKTEGGVLALLADRDLSGDGVETTMWGHGVRVAPGPAALALATKTALYPLAVYYEKLHGRRRWKARSRWGTVMDFGEPIEVSEGDKSERVLAMTHLWVAFIADKVAAHPEDWHMLQRFGWTE